MVASEYKKDEKIGVGGASIRFVVKTTGLAHLQGLLTEMNRRASDLTVYFNKVADDFFNENERLVFSESPGRFVDLTKKTKKYKSRTFGRVYPVLVGTGRLRKSLTRRGSPESVLKIAAKTMEMGTEVPYAIVHQVGLNGIPIRKPVDATVGKRDKKWLNWAGRYIVGEDIK
jgi:phage gpG-like protein